MITVRENGKAREYDNVSLRETDIYNILVTYKEDGELGYLYTRQGADRSDVTFYIADTTSGAVSDIQLWRKL